MIIHNPILTGSFTVNGTDVSSITSSAASLTSLNSYTASQNNRNGTYATTGSNTFAGIQTVNSNLVVTGSITAQTLVVQTVTSSVVYSSGSNVFGNNIANTQILTGSVTVTGSLAVVTTGTEFQVSSTGVNIGNVLTDSHVISGSFRVNPNGLFVSSSGNVGIGTTTPSSSLEVRIAGESPATGRVALIAATSNGINDIFRWFDGVTQLGVFKNSGNVGIINTDPQARLHIGAALANSSDITSGLILKQTGTNETTGIYLERSGERKGYAIYVGGSLDSLVFQRNNAGTKSDVMTLTRDGNVGIGTSSPNGLLDVNGNTVLRNRLGVGISTNETYASIFVGGDITSGVNQYALLCDPQLSGTSNSYAVFANARIKASTAVTNAFGVYIPSAEKLSGASITNNYALYIANQTSGASVNYSIYSSGGLNYFGGNVLVGQPTSDLNANGWQLQASGGGHTSFAINNNEAFIFNNRNTGTTYEIDFRTNVIERGKISVTDSGVSYITTPSDLNLKKNFEDWNENVLNNFKNLNPQKFNFATEEDDQPKTKGFIAQELVESFPEAYPKSKDRYFFNPSGMVVYLMKAIQELKAEIDELKNK